MKPIDKLIVLYGRRHNTSRVPAPVYVSCPRQANNCDVDFMVRQWEVAHGLRIERCAELRMSAH
jgi:hypothetical protein